MNQTISAILDYLKTNLGNPIAGSTVQWYPSGIQITKPSIKLYIDIIITADTKANIIIEGIRYKVVTRDSNSEVVQPITKRFIIYAHQPNLLEQILTAINQITQLTD
jgi:hypothetical protein